MSEEPITKILQQVAEGEEGAEERLYSLLYGELRSKAGGMMRAGENTLQPTAVVHEAWLKLSGGKQDWQSRAHFLGVAAKAMRSILIDHARAKQSVKRGGNGSRLQLDEAVQVYEERAINLLALDEALEELAAHDSELARLVELRFFGGLTTGETAKVLGVSTATVERSWRSARSLLRVLLGSDDDGA